MRSSLQGLLEQVDEGRERNPVEVVELGHVADREVEVRREGGHRQVDVALAFDRLLQRDRFFQRGLEPK